ncbi:hypothetical protein [Paenibacillus sinopodophylli]|uniref:hypothetical protein n=1 Tax=Paenibacillus sinopodophylli TaxID=1837342 RepID=UPI00110C9D49|nr:hypothetical protein [Paenibacillus sinopodophylli]
MARGKRIVEGKTLVVYSTKVVPETRALMDALAKANGPEFGQRELLEEMIPLYMAANPDKAQRAKALLELLGWGEQAASITPVIAVDFAAVENRVAANLGVTLPKTVQTVRYQGNPKVHLYEPGSKNSTGCGLAGTIDPESITDQEADAVTCGKCRYCRKGVFV